MNFSFFIAKRYFFSKLFNIEKIKIFFSFKGRIKRYEFIISSSILLLLSTLLVILFFKIAYNTIYPDLFEKTVYYLIFPVLLILTGWAQLAQVIKRSHDIGGSGWLIIFPPYILWLICRRGQDRDNKYGANSNLSISSRTNLVHIISLVSLFGVAIGTAALILVLSVFNGFEDLILRMYNSFDPHLKITSAEGKVFNTDKVQPLLDNDAIEKSSFVLEEKVLLKYQEKEYIAILKGVDENYLTITNFDSLMVDGEYLNKYENTNIAIIGRGVAYYLSMGVGNMFEQLQLYVPNRNSKTLLNPITAFKHESVLPIGIFGIQAEIDEKFIITPLAFIQNLTDRENEISAVEIKLKNVLEMLAVQKELQKELGDIFIVQNRLEQQEFLYKILNTEKLAVFLILTFIMIIATFNIIGALTMLMLDKKNDIYTFRSLGATKNEVQQIFFKKSVLTIITGTVIGLSVGLGLAFLQQAFGFIGMGNGSFVVDAYPVSIKLHDVLLVSTTVILIGLLASWYPAKILTKKLF